MSIIRGPRPQSHFYILDKSISEDLRLSWAARGMLVFLLGKPDHWEVSVASLVNATSGSIRQSGGHTKRDGVKVLIGELIDAGYMTKSEKPKHGETGCFEGYDYVVCEVPSPDNPSMADQPSPDWPSPAEPSPANPTQVSTDVLVRTEKAGSIDARGSRLPADWEPNEHYIEFCRQERPDLNVRDVAGQFRDYWISQPGVKGRKTNWLATWRFWVRNQRKVTTNNRKPTWYEENDRVIAELTGRNRKNEPDDGYIDV